MEFPRELLKNDRDPLDSSLFDDSCKLFIRHHPDHNWDNKMDIPDYSQIRLWSNQSCNINLLSLPVWVRFNNKREYKRNSAVVSYYVEHIRKPLLMVNKIGQVFHEEITNAEEITNQIAQLEGMIEPVHDPDEFNYSHCELRGNEPPRTIRKVLRFLLRHCAEAILKPQEDPTEEDITNWRIEMESLQQSKGI